MFKNEPPTTVPRHTSHAIQGNYNLVREGEVGGYIPSTGPAWCKGNGFLRGGGVAFWFCFSKWFEILHPLQSLGLFEKLI